MNLLTDFMRLQIYPVLLFVLAATLSSAQSPHFGFDKNGYPGDDLLPALHKSFDYAGYWLNNPPQAASNPWQGKRSVLIKNGFGFLLLFNGRLDAELKRQNPSALGHSDAEAAVFAARQQGFATHAIIFLDIEEGGRLLPEQLAYVLAWADALHHSAYRPGVYCSGISVPDGPGHTITTAQDVHTHDSEIALFVYNDACPPSPGCVLPSSPGGHPLSSPLAPTGSGIAEALVWQYAQSPRRSQFTSRCSKSYSPDNNCYAPGAPISDRTFVDLNVSTTLDPSAGR